MRWSSGFLKSSWTTLWSMYWTARSTRTRGTPSCSYCMHAIVPVASCSSVWSIRRATGDPASSSPSTRCSVRIWFDRFRGIGRVLLARIRQSRLSGRRRRHEHGTCLGEWLGTVLVGEGGGADRHLLSLDALHLGRQAHEHP